MNLCSLAAITIKRSSYLNIWYPEEAHIEYTIGKESSYVECEEIKVETHNAIKEKHRKPLSFNIK